MVDPSGARATTRISSTTAATVVAHGDGHGQVAQDVALERDAGDVGRAPELGTPRGCVAAQRTLERAEVVHSGTRGAGRLEERPLHVEHGVGRRGLGRLPVDEPVEVARAAAFVPAPPPSSSSRDGCAYDRAVIPC